MTRSKFVFFLLVLGFTFALHAQLKNLNGQLIASDEVEGLHILNRTAAKYTISKEDGSFVIPAKVSDTLFISGLKYESREFIITQAIVNRGHFSVILIEKINELNEVVVGKIFTGSLESDLENLDVKTDINFYDLGIPGSTKLPLTQSEQRLYDADHGKFVYYYGIGISINVHKILNRINGDTQKYKERVTREFKEDCIQLLKSEYSKTIFEAISIPENHKEEFFQFCLEDAKFDTLCDSENQINDVSFLLKKLKIFKSKLDENE